MRSLEELASGPPLDAAIIGGGINGCAIARDLASRGLRVALFEKDDFGFGTTWRTTKLIHGGLRYLEHGDLRLVFESLRERAWLLRTRPHLVRPQRFLLPLLPWTRRPAWQLRAGLATYDALALDGGLPGHARLDRREASAVFPGLADAANGAFSFYDARCVAPERLAVELAMEARALGASVFNHAPVIGVGAGPGGVESVQVLARGGALVTVPVKAVVNAAGPWVDAVNRLTGSPATELLGVTKGTHIVLEPHGPLPKAAIFSTARSDGRVFFAIPRDGLLLVGTTDDRFEGPPDSVAPTASEAEYLLAEVNLLLPGLGLDRSTVRYAYAGLRPLQRVAGGPESAITRRHEVIEHRRRDGGPPGLFSVIGGKLSTFRPLAADVAKALGAADRPVKELPPAGGQAWLTELRSSNLSARSKRHLSQYGPGASTILAGNTEELSPSTGALLGEVAHAITREGATTLSDILLRRTGIGWGPERGLDCHKEAAAAAMGILGWGTDRWAAEVKAYEEDVSRHLPTLAVLP